MLQHSTSRPTAAEKQWIERIKRYGCICCLEAGYRGTERVEIHHIVETKRLGHFFVLPLCIGHHRGVWSRRQVLMLPPERRVAISDGLKAFVVAFGSERELWIVLRDHVGLPVQWPASKILPRRLA